MTSRPGRPETKATRPQFHSGLMGPSHHGAPPVSKPFPGWDQVTASIGWFTTNQRKGEGLAGLRGAIEALSAPVKDPPLLSVGLAHREGQEKGKPPWEEAAWPLPLPASAGVGGELGMSPDGCVIPLLNDLSAVDYWVGFPLHCQCQPTCSTACFGFST